MVGTAGGSDYVRTPMEPAVPFVQGADDLTVDWCNAALGPSLAGGRVVAVTTAPVGTGQVADTVRLHLTYDDAGRGGPATLVAKVPAADETSRAGARFSRTYEIEASFYRDLAPVLPVRTPDCHHASHDPETDGYVVLLEDVAPARQGDQMEGCPVSDIAAAIDELVLLQGPRWGDDTLLEIPWLHRSSPEAIDGLVALVTHAVGPFREHYTDRLDADTLALVDRLVPRLDGYLAPGPVRGRSSTETSGPTTCCSERSGWSSSTGRPSGWARGRPTSATCSGPASGPTTAAGTRPHSSTATCRGSSARASTSTGTTCGRSTGATRSAG